MIKKIFMYLLNLFFERKSGDLPDDFEPKKILIIRTDERLGEIIITLPLINHLKNAFYSSSMTFLMCEKYGSLSKYIRCDNFIFFDKRWLFINPIRFIKFVIWLMRESYDLVVLGGKINPPSLTSYLLLGIARGKYKAAIKQSSFNPFVNIKVEIDTKSEPLSKHLLGEHISGKSGEFDNSLQIDGEIEKENDILIFLDGRKRDHLIPIELLKDIIEQLLLKSYKIVVVSGINQNDRIERIKEEFGDKISYAESPHLDSLIEKIKRSRAVICGNTGVLHLSVALGIPTTGLFTNADPDIWGYNYKPHRMIDLRIEKFDPDVIVENISETLAE